MQRSATWPRVMSRWLRPLRRGVSYESERDSFVRSINEQYRLKPEFSVDSLMESACRSDDYTFFRDLALYCRDFGLQIRPGLQDTVIGYAAQHKSLFCMSIFLRLIRSTGSLTADSLYFELYYNHYNGKSVQGILSQHYAPNIVQMSSPRLFILFESILPPSQRQEYYDSLRRQLPEEAFDPYMAGYLRLLSELKSEDLSPLLWSNIGRSSLLSNGDFQSNILVFLGLAWNPPLLKENQAQIAPILTQSSWDMLMRSSIVDEKKLNLLEQFGFPHLNLQSLPLMLTICAKSNRVSLLRTAEKFSKRVDSAPLHILFARLYSQQKKVQSAYTHWKILLKNRVELSEEDVLLAMETFGELGNSVAFLACYNHYIKGKYISPTIILKILVIQYSLFPTMSPIPFRNEVLGRTYPLLENARDKAWLLRNMF